MRARNGLCILTLDVFAENRPVMSTVALLQEADVSRLEKTVFRGRHIPVEKWKDSLEY